MKKVFMLIIVLFLVQIQTDLNSQNIKQPKNIIIMIGDGMGFEHVKAGAYYLAGELNREGGVFLDFPTKLAVACYPAKVGSKGEDGELIWSRGYNTFDNWNDLSWRLSGYTCSAASGTAIATGYKTANAFIGLDINKEPIENITEFAKSIGKSAGVITTVQLSHATPAAFVAHNIHRNNYSEIAHEMILNSKLDVLIGGGHPYFDHDAKPLNKAHTFKFVGDSLIWVHLNTDATIFKLTDGSFSVQDIDGDGIADSWKLIQKKADFEKIATTANPPKRLLGVLPVAETSQQRRGTKIGAGYGSGGKEDAFAVPFNDNVPSLATIAGTALNVLKQNSSGFFLMVEGGAIDWAGHSNQPGRLIEEYADFADAVKFVYDWVENNSSWDETLLIVTADHETGYLTGPNFNISSNEFVGVVNQGKGKMPLMKFNSDNHTNDLVPFYAIGAGREIFYYFADEHDKVYGEYLHNSEIGKAMKLLWNNWK